MLKLETFRDNINIRRREIAEENLKFQGDVDILYAHGHLFTLTDDWRKLESLDVVAPTNQIFNVDSGSLIQVSKDDRILKVIFTDEVDKIYTVFTSGNIEEWTFSQSTPAWSCTGRRCFIQKDPRNDKEVSEEESSCDPQVVDFVFHRLHNGIYWCERRSITDKATKYDIFGRTFTFGCDRDEGQVSAGDSNSCLGAVTHVLSDCPPAYLHICQDSLLFLFRPPCPPGVYMKWQPSSRTLTTFVHPLGEMHTHKVFLTAVNFREVSMKTAAVWSKVQPISDWTPVRVLPQENPLFVDPSGVLWTTEKNKEFSKRILLQNETVWKRNDLKAMLCQFGIIVTFMDRILLYDIENGELVQELSADVCSGAVTIWMSNCGMFPGVATRQAIYSLKLSGSLTWQPCGYAERVLSRTGQELQAALLHLEALKLDNNNQVTTEDRPFNLRNLQQSLQSPALLLSLLHKKRSSGENVIMLDEVLKTSDTQRPNTSLALDLAPLVQVFTQLEKHNWQQFVRPELTESKSLETEVREALNSVQEDDQQVAYEQYSYLATRWPSQVAMATVKCLCLEETGEGNGCTAEFWEALRTAGSGNHHGNTLLISVAHLLMLHAPAHIMKYLELSCQGGKEEHAAFRGVSQAQFYTLLLPHLPHPALSVDTRLAALATASVTTRSGKPNCELDSLRLLLRHELWQDAVHSLTCAEKNSPLYIQLFQFVISATSQAGVFPQYCETLLMNCPDNISGVSLLQQMKAGYQASGPQQFTNPLVKESMQFSRVSQVMNKYLQA